MVVAHLKQKNITGYKDRSILKVTMNKKKIPIPLTTFTVAATMATSLMVADVAYGDSSGANSYHYYNDHLGSSYEDTSPNLANFMTSPGVAAALFFSTAGVSFSPNQYSIVFDINSILLMYFRHCPALFTLKPNVQPN